MAFDDENNQPNNPNEGNKDGNLVYQDKKKENETGGFAPAIATSVEGDQIVPTVEVAETKATLTKEDGGIEFRFESSRSIKQSEIDLAIADSNKISRRNRSGSKNPTADKGNKKSISFDVNNTTIVATEDDEIEVPTIHLFPGATFDPAGSSFKVGKIDEQGNVEINQMGQGCRIILALNGIAQIMQVGAANVVIKGQNGIGTVEGDVDGYLAFILKDFSTLAAPGDRFNCEEITSKGGGMLVGPDGLVSKADGVKVTRDGVFLDNKVVEELRTSESETEAAAEKASSSGTESASESVSEAVSDTVSEAIEGAETSSAEVQEQVAEVIASTEGISEEAGRSPITPKERSTVNVEGSIASAGFGALVDAVKGNCSGANVEGKVDQNILKSDPNAPEITEALKNDAIGIGIDAGLGAAKALFTKKNILKGAGQTSAVKAAMNAAHATKDVSALMKSLRSLNCLPEPVLAGIEKAFTATEGGANKLVELTGGGEALDKAKEKEQKTEKRTIFFSLKVIPGLLTLTVKLVPIYSLDIGTGFDFTNNEEDEYLKSITLGINALGKIGLALAGEVQLGNCLLALTGEVSVGGYITGNLGGGGKFFDISDFVIDIEKGSKGLSASTAGTATLSLGAKANVFLEGAISVGSTIINWKKDLVAKKVEATLASIALTGEVTKIGHLMSINGWSLDNVDLSTALFDNAKAQANEFKFSEGNNIIGIGDFLASTVDRSDRLNDLNEKLSLIKNVVSGADAMAFSKDDDQTVNKKLAADLELLWDAYDGLIVVSRTDMEMIQNKIEAYFEVTKEPLAAVEKSLKKRRERKEIIDKWAEENQGKFADNSLTRDDVYKFYKEQAKGDYFIYRRDKEIRKKEATNAIYTKENIIAYEKSRADKKRKVHVERVDKIMAAIDELDITNPKEANEEFLKKYIEIRGGGKGFINHLLTKGVSQGIFTEEEMTARLLEYEKNRIREKVDEYEDIDKVLKKYKAIDENKVSVNFNKDARSADKKLWKQFAFSSLGSNGIYEFEKKRTVDRLHFGNKDRYRNILNLKAQRKEYNNETDETKKAEILKKGNEDFLKMLDKGEKKKLADPKNFYMLFSADKLREQIKKAADENFYLENINTEAGKSLKDLGGNDVKAAKKVMAVKANKKIYEKYIDHLVEEKKYGSKVFDISKILEYEKKRESAAKKGSGDKTKYQERIEFLEEGQKYVSGLLKMEKASGGDETEKQSVNIRENVIEMYFTGERPAGYEKKNKATGKKQEKTGQYTVATASAYIKELKKNPTKEGMEEAIRWNALNQDNYQKYIKASTDEETDQQGSAVNVYEKWKKIVGEDNAMAVLNKAEKEKDQYSFEGMISFYEYMIGSDTYMNRVDAIEKMMEDGKGDDEIIRFYVETLKGGDSFATNAAESEDVGLTPAMYKDFYTSEKGVSILNKRNTKHDERIRKIEETADYNAMVKWYTVISGGEEFEKKLIEDPEIRKRLTPSVILDYEMMKEAQGSTKHYNRIQKVQSTTSDEGARAAYQKMNGGAGFSKEHKSQISAKMDELYNNRDGKGELEIIYEYEQFKTQEWLKLREKYLQPVEELNNRKALLARQILTAQGNMAGIDKNLDVLKNGTENLTVAKAAIDTADKGVKKAAEVEPVVQQLEEARDTNEKLIAEHEKQAAAVEKQVEETKKNIEELDKEHEKK